MHQQQFATLTRHHQQQLGQNQQSAIANLNPMNSINYTQLMQQQQQQQAYGTNKGARLIHLQQTATAGVPGRQTPSNTVVGQQSTVPNKIYLQQQQQQQQQQPQTIQSQQLHPTSGYARKSVVEWSIDDVQEWLQRIGMAEHRSKFETFNGAKLLRMDNNALANIGVRQQPHRIYLLEKLKQQIWQQTH
ncbi:hypothetical protein QR98_0097810 [Sarcoptes scabiei]|uniref:Uncharacterized protein n=1 Tax=Sarcoptes scabiei TaxID=52283 RepID=A0A132AJQ9_SARSC|nr:hypothetical protein QR98_0097810 [Sarcoptes scabiei]